MPYSLAFLLSDDAATIRVAERKPAFVVHLEVVAGYDRETPRFEEMDADSVEHAENIGDMWKTHGMCHSYSVRPVSMLNGKLHKQLMIR